MLVSYPINVTLHYLSLGRTHSTWYIYNRKGFVILPSLIKWIKPSRGRSSVQRIKKWVCIRTPSIYGVYGKCVIPGVTCDIIPNYTEGHRLLKRHHDQLSRNWLNSWCNDFSSHQILGSNRKNFHLCSSYSNRRSFVRQILEELPSLPSSLSSERKLKMASFIILLLVSSSSILFNK